MSRRLRNFHQKSILDWSLSEFVKPDRGRDETDYQLKSKHNDSVQKHYPATKQLTNHILIPFLGTCYRENVRTLRT